MLSSNKINDLSRNIVEYLLKGISERLGDLKGSNSLLLSTFLDHRFKTFGFSNESVSARVKGTVQGIITSNINEQLAQQPSAIKEQISTADSVTNEKFSSIWSSFDKKVASIKPSGTAYSRAIIEVQRYLEEPPIPRQEDPMKWWHDNAYNFPYLSAVVKQKFVVVCTSVSCETIFSKSGQILSDRRNRLSSTKLKKILFLNCNKEIE